MDETGDSSVLLVARCLMAGLFLWSGIGQASGYDETTVFMLHAGVIGHLLPIAIAIEVGGALHLPRSGRLLRRDGAAVPRQLRRQGADVPLPQERRHRRRPARALRLGTGPPVVRWDKRGVTLLLPIQMGRCPEGAEGSLAAASVEATIHLLAAKRFVDRLHDLLRPREDVAVPEP